MMTLKKTITALAMIIILSTQPTLAATATVMSHTVMVLFEAKPGQETALKEALEAVVEPSRSESHSIEYRLHQSKENPAQYMLYENWQSAELHQTQFEKPYIKELGAKLEGMLAKPYTVFVGAEIAN